MTASSASGHRVFRIRAEGGAWLMCIMITPMALSATKGICPVIIS
jgi:hypothetical protein